MFNVMDEKAPFLQVKQTYSGRCNCVRLTLEVGTDIKWWDLHKRVGLTLEGGTNIRGWD